MVMTPAEIVADYKQAKTPMKQIGILADLNTCTRREIVQVLEEAGVEIPKIYQAKAPKKPAAAPAPAPSLDPVRDTISRLAIKAAALDAITVLINQGETDVTREIRGIIMLVRKIEEV